MTRTTRNRLGLAIGLAIIAGLWFILDHFFP